jgi:hypothetical protein
MGSRVIKVNDWMQSEYSYSLSEPMAENFHPEFRPELAPAQMLAMGIFGGKYMTDCQEEYPSEWFLLAKLNSGRNDPKLNFFQVHASKPLSYWREKGWIWPNDPRGWFQWYCRYYLGRRHPDDGRQVKRWKAMRRHIAQIRNNCTPGDLTCRPRQRQALLHWAYDSREI